MELETFLDLPTAEVARIVREAGPKVCVFPINGTRRWFMLEYPDTPRENFVSSYLNAIYKRDIELYTLFFDHGIDTLLSPIFGLDLLERGTDYLQIAADGMAGLGTRDDFLRFYQTYDVRVRFYGDYDKYLSDTPLTYLIDLFNCTTTLTLSHNQHRLFFGVFAQDATETIAELSIKYHEKHHKVPNKRDLIIAYYGEFVPSVDIFIGFDKFSAFDMPLVSTGDEDLYFTVTPSPYLNQKQLRMILYDHLYTRYKDESDYMDFSLETWQLMHQFYQSNLEKTQGIGRRTDKGFWYPLPQVDLPQSLGG